MSNPRAMRHWDGPRSPGEDARIMRRIVRKIMHEPRLNPRRLRHTPREVASR